MRRFFRFLFRTLVLVVVFLAAFLTAMRFAIHGRQTTVPKVIGLAQSQAERQLSDHGLVLDQGDRYFSSDVPPGRVMSQIPAAGLQVRRGWHVRVAESMGPQRVVIPDLLGNSERAAEINIRRRGLELGAVASAAIPNAPPDQIIAQSPPANAVNVSEPKISLLMAAAPDTDSFVMPDLVGRSEDDAINVIVDAGMHVPTINTQAAQPTPPPATTPGSTPPAASTGSGSRMVVKTTPAAGQRIFAGQPIALEVTQ
jgi:beta-lactam-binding protein with PASTA domain